MLWFSYTIIEFTPFITKLVIKLSVCMIVGVRQCWLFMKWGIVTVFCTIAYSFSSLQDTSQSFLSLFFSLFCIFSLSSYMIISVWQWEWFVNWKIMRVFSIFCISHSSLVNIRQSWSSLSLCFICLLSDILGSVFIFIIKLSSYMIISVRQRRGLMLWNSVFVLSLFSISNSSLVNSSQSCFSLSLGLICLLSDILWPIIFIIKLDHHILLFFAHDIWHTIFIKLSSCMIISDCQTPWGMFLYFTCVSSSIFSLFHCFLIIFSCFLSSCLNLLFCHCDSIVFSWPSLCKWWRSI